MNVPGAAGTPAVQRQPRGRGLAARLPDRRGGRVVFLSHCPEEHAWGGVQKLRLLGLYGSGRWLPAPLRRLVLPLLLAHTRRVYARLARDTARQVADYRRTGHEVVAIVGVDGSPSCGVARTLDIPAAVERLARADRRTLTPDAVNAVVRDTLVPGRGLFTEQLVRDLRRRRIDVPYLAHDLLGELDGNRSPAAAELRRVPARGEPRAF